MWSASWVLNPTENKRDFPTANSHLSEARDMHLDHIAPLALIPLLFGLADAREQQVFSAGHAELQIIGRNHTQPWSLLVSLDLDTASCVVLQPLELAQPHHSLQSPDDVQVIPKSSSSFDGMAIEGEGTIEILALDQGRIWSTVNEMCDHVEFEYFSDHATLAEYEVVWRITGFL
jgi:hypothetical protein